VNTVLNYQLRQQIIQWLYDLQIDSNSGFSNEACGFRGFALADSLFTSRGLYCLYDSGHIAQTYTALCCLIILGDDLSRLDRRTILQSIRSCQLPDGSFCASNRLDTENDMRFLYCAVAICTILDDFSYIDIEKILSFIRSSISYDGGIGQGPQLESHGGSTYCALASLSMLGRLWDFSVLSSKKIERLKRWIVFKHGKGFHGRTNKRDDSCYAFWLGASLEILNSLSLVDRSSLRSFLMHAQDLVVGGFSKYEDYISDLLHTCLGISALAIFHEPLISPVFPELNLSRRSYEHLRKIQSSIK